MNSATVFLGFPRSFALVLLAVLMLVGVREAAAQQALVRGFVTDSTTEQSLQGAVLARHAYDQTF